jgi:cytoplasmic iron level regulating protein YaaA (DUF328/UPF0246 family)
MTNEKPQYIIDAENRYNHMKAVVGYINNNFDKYSAIVKYAKDNWGTMITASVKYKVSIADQIATITECPYYVAEDVARMINYQYQNK